MAYTTKDSCESCMMPFSKDPKGGDREHEKHCSFCCVDGKFAYEGEDVNEFKKELSTRWLRKDMVAVRHVSLRGWQASLHVGRI